MARDYIKSTQTLRYIHSIDPHHITLNTHHPLLFRDTLSYNIEINVPDILRDKNGLPKREETSPIYNDLCYPFISCTRKSDLIDGGLLASQFERFPRITQTWGWLVDLFRVKLYKNHANVGGEYLYSNQSDIIRISIIKITK